MAKRRTKEYAENHERWLVSYADFITLLFAFFVVMYGMSAVDAKKMKQVAQSFQQAFNPAGLAGTGPAGIGTIPVIEAQLAQSLVELSPVEPELFSRLTTIEQQEQTELQGLERTIQEALQRSIEERKLLDMVHLYIDEHGLVISLSAKYFFDSGKAVLRPEVLPIIDQIASILKPADREIRIEGHTDDVPIQTTSYPSNWELSAARATYVIKYLVDKFKLPPTRLSAAGYGEFRPIASNLTDGGRARNRRVDIVVLSRKLVLHLLSHQMSSSAAQQSLGLEKE
jgi:chemotaxis protein MotB